MNVINNILVTLILLVTSTIFANDYDANYYKDEGALLFKIYGLYINTTAKLKQLLTFAVNT